MTLNLVNHVLRVPAAYAITGKRLNLNIAIVEASLLHMHEEIIPALLDELARSIELDGRVKNPIIVDETSLVVLDGVHRVAALQKLGINRVPACLVDYSNPAIQVLSWYRSVIGAQNPSEVTARVKSAGCVLKQTDVFNRKVIGFSPTVAILKFRDQTFLVNCLFTHLSETYDIIGRIEERLKAAGFSVRYETEQDALENLEENRVDAVLCTPKISKEEIVESALSGRVYEWKATRHVIPSRPLNVNVPLSLLKDKNRSLPEANDELKRLLQSRRLKGLPSGSIVDGRRYEEELYVFEEQDVKLNVTVRPLGVFRGLVGKDHVKLKLEHATVRDVIQAVAEMLPSEARTMLIDPELNDPRSNAIILLNGREINVLEGLETMLSDGDEVTVIPVAHGG